MLSLGDLMGLSVPPGLMLGRIANFINAELWGRPDRPALGRGLSGRGGADLSPASPGVCARHPSQLYEAALEGLAAGRAGAVAGLAARLAEGAGAGDGGVHRGLRAGAVRGRIRPPARCAVRDRGQPVGPVPACGRLGADDGATPVAADDRGGAVVRAARPRAARHDAAGAPAGRADRAQTGRSRWPTTWPNACCIPSMAITPRATPLARRAISPPRPKSARCSAN